MNYQFFEEKRFRISFLEFNPIMIYILFSSNIIA